MGSIGTRLQKKGGNGDSFSEHEREKHGRLEIGEQRQ